MVCVGVMHSSDDSFLHQARMTESYKTDTINSAIKISMKLRFIRAAYASFFFLGCISSGTIGAQAQRISAEEYKKIFINNVNEGCKKNKPTNSTFINHNTYCSCYAEGFRKRYNANQLQALANALPKDRKISTDVTTAFMSPEIKACRR